MKSLTSRLIVIASLGGAFALFGCNSVLGIQDGTLGDPNGGAGDTGSGGDTGVVADTGTLDTASVDTGSPDTATPDTGIDTGIDTGSDAGVDAPDALVFPEGGVAAAPIAGGFSADSPKYHLITSTTMGGGNGPPSSSKYSLHGGTVSVTPR